MLPGPLAPLDPHKTRALTTIYAPQKHRHRKNNTAQPKMLDNDLQIKPTLSPFHPLPAIGQKIERSKTKVILFDLKSDTPTEKRVKLHDVLKPLTPLRIHGFRRNSLDREERRQHLLRENTYDVIEPLYVKADKVRMRDSSLPRRLTKDNDYKSEVKDSPKTRFKKAALQVAKLNSMPETRKLLNLRERQTFNTCYKEDESCKLQKLPQSPAEKLNKISEIFQHLDMKGHHRDKMKKENSWF